MRQVTPPAPSRSRNGLWAGSPACRRTSTSTVILDTCVLLSDPESLFAFGDADVVLPLMVVEELNQQKDRRDDVGYAARSVLRQVEALRVANRGEIRTPVPLETGGTVRVETNGLHLRELSERGLDPDLADNRILAAALGLAVARPVTVVSNDAALRIKASQLGLPAEEYVRFAGPDEDDAGWVSADVPSDLVDALHRTGSISLDRYLDGGGPPVRPHQFLVLRAGQQSVLAKRRSDELVTVGRRLEAWGLRPRSKEQTFALELLTDPDVAVVALSGHAGTGKTILALAAGLEQVMETKPRYDRLAIYRPVVPVAKTELGFLPGSLEEKLDPWMMAVTDAIVALSEEQSHAQASRLLEEMKDRKKLTMESVAHLRGRSLQKSFIVIDEAQNLEPLTLKTILTRIGQGTKVVFTGDISQQDHAWVSRTNNALSVLIERFAGEECFGHIVLTKGERSAVAELAARKL